MEKEDMSEHQDDREYRRRREARRKAVRRRKRQRLISRILLICCLAAAVILVGVIAVRYVGGKGGGIADSAEKTVSGSSEAGAASAAASGTSSVKATSGTASSGKTSSGTASSGKTSSGTASASSGAADSAGSAKVSYDNSVPWTYTSDAAVPSGDIVATDNVVYTFDQMENDLYLLQKKYPDIVRMRKFGTSLDNRDLIEAVIGDSGATKDIVIQYSMHAREYICTLLGMKQLESLLQNYQTGDYNGTKYTDLFKNVRFHIIPMMNPDGVMISEKGIDAIRDENLKKELLAVYQSDMALGKGSTDINEYWLTWKANARSVDLNRNFATSGWTTEMGTQQPSCSRYPGASANSEPEVKALISLTESMNTVCEIAYHCHGRYIYYDYGMESINPDLYKRDYALAQSLDGLTAQDGHEPYELLSTVKDSQNPGGCSDYYMQIVQIPALTIEVGRKFKDDGSYNDPPLAISEFPLMWKENSSMIPAIAQFFQ